MPDSVLISATLPPTGDTLLTPPLGDPARRDYRIILEGVVTFDYTGQQFDALHKAGRAGAFTAPHDTLQWQPRAPEFVGGDPATHRYEFRIPPDWKIEGQSLGARIDVDRLVNEYLIPPSEVRRQLSGGLKLTVLQAPVVSPSPWSYIAGASLSLALAAGGVGLIIRRRMAYAGLTLDLQAAVQRVEQKARAAQAALTREHRRLFPLHERIAVLRQGAIALARQIRDLRRAQRLVDRDALTTEIGSLEAQLPALGDTAAAREGSVALEQKRKTLALLDDLAAAEQRCIMRLAKVDAVLDATCVGLRSAAASAAPLLDEDALRRELDAEVAALQEVADDLPPLDLLETQRPRGEVR